MHALAPGGVRKREERLRARDARNGRRRVPVVVAEVLRRPAHREEEGRPVDAYPQRKIPNAKPTVSH